MGEHDVFFWWEGKMGVHTRFVVVVLDDDAADSLQTKVGEDEGSTDA